MRRVLLTSLPCVSFSAPVTQMEEEQATCKLSHFIFELNNLSYMYSVLFPISCVFRYMKYQQISTDYCSKIPTLTSRFLLQWRLTHGWQWLTLTTTQKWKPKDLTCFSKHKRESVIWWAQNKAEMWIKHTSPVKNSFRNFDAFFSSGRHTAILSWKWFLRTVGYLTSGWPEFIRRSQIGNSTIEKRPNELCCLSVLHARRVQKRKLRWLPWLMWKFQCLHRYMSFWDFVNGFSMAQIQSRNILHSGFFSHAKKKLAKLEKSPVSWCFFHSPGIGFSLPDRRDKLSVRVWLTRSWGDTLHLSSQDYLQKLWANNLAWLERLTDLHCAWK